MHASGFLFQGGVEREIGVEICIQSLSYSRRQYQGIKKKCLVKKKEKIRYHFGAIFFCFGAEDVKTHVFPFLTKLHNNKYSTIIFFYLQSSALFCSLTICQHEALQCQQREEVCQHRAIVYRLQGSAQTPSPPGCLAIDSCNRAKPSHTNLHKHQCIRQE